MQDVYFNGSFIQPKIIRVGNIIRGFDATFLCDAPWGWTYPQILSYNYPDDVTSTSFNFYNDTDNDFYSFPQLSFTVANVGGSISLTNLTDDPTRVFQFTGLQGNEILTVDNDLQIITSSTGLRRLSNFNYNFFRLIKGLNQISLNANINQLDMTYQFARKLAG